MPGKKGRSRVGDLIVAINGIATPDIDPCKNTFGGEKSAKLSVIRSGIALKQTSCQSATLRYPWYHGQRYGRSIGTMTYYDPQGQIFAALGHGINDSGILMPLWREDHTGQRTAAVKGERGAPTS